MEKPITLLREELRQNITNQVNQAGLPAFVVADMFESFLRELRQLERDQLARDRQSYDQSIAEAEVGDE